MLIDILIFGPMLVFTLVGFRDGVVRKLVAIVMFIAALFLGQLFRHDLAQLLTDNGWIESTDAPMYAYLIIFFAVATLQGLLYKVLTKSYKISGFIDRVGGLVFGFVEGAVFLSCLLYILTPTGFPSRDLKRDSMFYKPIVNLAPQILDETSFIETEPVEKLKNSDNDQVVKGHWKKSGVETVDTSAVIDEKKTEEMLKHARETQRKKNP